MQVTFRCKRSGNTVSFFDENDIESMRKHEGYEEVKEIEDGLQEEIQAPAEEVTHSAPLIVTAKPRGRPRKVI